MSFESAQPIEIGPRPIETQNQFTVSASELSLKGLDLYITTNCNRRCTHCFLTDEWLNSRQLMDEEMVSDIVDWATAPGSSIEEITLLGGEPSTHQDFPKLAQIIHEANLGARIVTNGSPSFRSALDAYPDLTEQITRTAISIDAPNREAHDKIRGHGTYNWTLATAAALKDRNMPFDINTTVIKDNLTTVPQMIQHAERLGAQRLNIHWFSLTGRGRIHAANQVPSTDEWRKVLDSISKYSSTTGMVVDCELGYAYGLPGEDTDMCKVRSSSNLQISPDGSALSCGMLAETPHKSGYLWKRGNLYRRNAVNDEVALTNGDDCNGCPLREISGGLTPLCIYNRLSTKN